MSVPSSPVPPYSDGPPAVPAQQLSYAAPGMEAIVLTPRAYEMLRQTRPWVAFIGWVLFIIGVLAIAGSVIAGAVVATQQRGAFALPFIAYFVAGLLYLFPGIYLKRYAARIRDVMNLRASEHLEAALEAQKSFWRLVGILFALVVGLYVLIILFAVVGLAAPRFFR